MDKGRSAEIAGLERGLDFPAVLPDLGYARGILGIVLVFDPSPIGQGVEHVRGDVLVHAHAELAASLKGGELRVGSGVGSWGGPACHQAEGTSQGGDGQSGAVCGHDWSRSLV